MSLKTFFHLCGFFICYINIILHSIRAIFYYGLINIVVSKIALLKLNINYYTAITNLIIVRLTGH